MPPRLKPLGKSKKDRKKIFLIVKCQCFGLKNLLLVWVLTHKNLRKIALFFLCKKAVFQFLPFYPYFTQKKFKKLKISQNGHESPHGCVWWAKIHNKPLKDNQKNLYLKSVKL